MSRLHRRWRNRLDETDQQVLAGCLYRLDWMTVLADGERGGGGDARDEPAALLDAGGEGGRRTRTVAGLLRRSILKKTGVVGTHSAQENTSATCSYGSDKNNANADTYWRISAGAGLATLTRMRTSTGLGGHTVSMRLVEDRDEESCGTRYSEAPSQNRKCRRFKSAGRLRGGAHTDNIRLCNTNNGRRLVLHTGTCCAGVV